MTNQVTNSLCLPIHTHVYMFSNLYAFKSQKPIKSRSKQRFHRNHHQTTVVRVKLKAKPQRKRSQQRKRLVWSPQKRCDKRVGLDATQQSKTQKMIYRRMWRNLNHRHHQRLHRRSHHRHHRHHHQMTTVHLKKKRTKTKNQLQKPQRCRYLIALHCFYAIIKLSSFLLVHDHRSCCWPLPNCWKRTTNFSSFNVLVVCKWDIVSSSPCYTNRRQPPHHRLLLQAAKATAKQKTNRFARTATYNHVTISVVICLVRLQALYDHCFALYSISWMLFTYVAALMSW